MTDWIMKRFAFLAIVFVSGCAFAAGFVQNNIAARGDDYREEAISHENTIARMEDRLEFINQIDGGQALKALDQRAEGIVLMMRYNWFYDNMSADERTWAQIEILYALGSANGNIAATNANFIDLDFTNNPSQQTYDFSTKATYGYDYKIKREDWQQYPPIEEISRDDWIEDWTLGSITSAHPEILAALPAIFLEMNWNNIYKLYRQPIEDEMDDLDYWQEQADKYEGYANRITIGVAITTVAVVLVAAMANRLADKKNDHDFSQIRADILKNRALIVTERDMLAYLVLFLAILISVIGLILPFFTIL